MIDGKTRGLQKAGLPLASRSHPFNASFVCPFCENMIRAKITQYPQDGKCAKCKSPIIYMSNKEDMGLVAMRFFKGLGELDWTEQDKGTYKLYVFSVGGSLAVVPLTALDASGHGLCAYIHNFG